MANFEFLKGNVEVIILNSLYQKDRYGYEIVKEIKEKTQSTYEIKQPTLYAYLKRLESGGLIESYWGEESSGGRRKYYKLTEDGKAQCESFLSEWKYQKTVMDSLVADEADTREITQEDATPLLGSKIKKQSRNAKTVSIEEQQNLSALLEQLTTVKTQDTNLANETNAQEKDQSSVKENNSSDEKDLSLKDRQEKSPEPKKKGLFGLFRANKNKEESVATTHTEYDKTNNDAQTVNSNYDFQVRDYEEDISQDGGVSNSSYFEDAPQQENPQKEQQETLENDSVQSEYFTQQRDKETFFKEFNKRAQRIIDSKKNADDIPPYEQSEVRKDEQAEEDEKNYKYVLGNVLKKQLADAASIPEATVVDTEEKFSQSQNDEPLTMEALVDTFALQGIKVRLYNKEISSYSPQAMLYKNKINLLSSWLTYITFACMALFVWLGFRDFFDTAYAIAFITVPLLLPIALTVLYFMNPSKKVSPKFDFKYHIINTLIAFVLLTLLIFTLFLLLGGEFENTQAVLSYIVFPAVAAASIPLYILYYKLFFKKALV